MKRTLKKAMSILLAAVMICGTSVCMKNFVAEATAATITSYNQGDIIEFGWYPQTEVTDEILIAAFNIADGEWVSYGYYSGTGYSDGQMIAKDYMRYKDVAYGSDKYRGVVFDTYRPYSTEYESTTSSSGTHQDDNGYYTGTVYWFKYEPIEWRVLDPDTGMVMAETILDSQAYNNYLLNDGTDEYGYDAYWGDSSKTYYANNYANSSIREWLNEDFYNTAFSTAQKNIIQYASLDNSAFKTYCSAYDSVTSYDKIYLLSWDEVLNTEYGLSTSSYSEYDDDNRIAQGSDYAKCQGLEVQSDSTSDNIGNSAWLLRSAGMFSNFTCDVGHSGTIFVDNRTFETCNGVRPALNLNLNSETLRPDTSETDPTTKAEETTVPSTNLTTHVETTTESMKPTTTKPTEPSKEPTTEPSTTKPYIEEEIIKKPSTTEVKYGETLILHADFTNIPAGAKIEWSVEGEGVTIKPSADGKTCAVTSTATGDVTITAKYVDANGIEHVSEQEIESNASLWQKIVSFFKNLFGMNRIIEQAIRF